MSQQFYNLQKTAEMLGIAPADVNQLREQRKLHGYRSGSDWKFKVEDVESLLAERIKATGSAAPEGELDDLDALDADIQLDESDPAASGTVIGESADAVDEGESDIQLADSEMAIEAASGDTDFEDADDDSEFDLDLTIDEDIVMEDSQFSLAGEESGTDRASATSEVDLASEGEVLDDDDLVLGGSDSGSGSDITIAGDSGISLVDPNDSGLSLDEPVDLSGDSESLELGEDDMLTLAAGADADIEDLPGDDDFLLTPLEDAGDEDDESGSQVIALDTEEGDEGATLVAADDGMIAMLDEDTSLDEPLAAVSEVPDMTAIAAGPAMTAGPVMAGQSAAALPETPYGALWTTMLTICVCFLGLCGILSYDIMRNMWSWSGEYTVNSTIMDTILSFIQ